MNFLKFSVLKILILDPYATVSELKVYYFSLKRLDMFRVLYFDNY